MTKKIILYLSIVILTILNIILDINVNNYISILNNCFSKNIILNNFYYSLICVIIALISILITIAIKLIIFYEKEEIKGINLKSEDGTFGTANWLSDNELNNILGKNKAPGLILGKKDNDIIKLPFDSHFNKNISVFGSSGSMKTIRIFNYQPS
jgi:type IV secretory pathway TraG/TraD family ATPase VirD4